MSECELPDVPTTQMDERYLAALIRVAMGEFNEFIRARKFGTKDVNILRRTSGHLFESLPRPDIHEAMFSYFYERIDTASAQELLNYLWDHGGHRLRRSRDDGDPDRRGWAGNAFHEVVVVPVWRLWDEYSVRALSEDGAWEPWNVPPKAIERSANDIAAIEVGKSAIAEMIVPLLGIRLSGQSCFELENQIALRAWTQAEKAVYLHRHGSNFLFEETFDPHNSECYLHIVAYGIPNNAAVADYAADIIGRMKWALVQSIDSKHSIYELPLVVTWQTGVSWAIRREGIRRKFIAALDFGNSQYALAVRHLQQLTATLRHYPDLVDVLWLYDRAMLSNSSRDLLLEAAIGLERLLVQGSGENARRFRQYGAAIIYDTNPPVVERNLKKIYNLRSRAAHEGTRHAKAFEDLGILARSYLGRAIEGVVRLVATSGIAPSGQRINEALEQYLVSVMHTATQAALRSSKCDP